MSEKPFNCVEFLLGDAYRHGRGYTGMASGLFASAKKIERLEEENKRLLEESTKDFSDTENQLQTLTAERDRLAAVVERLPDMAAELERRAFKPSPWFNEDQNASSRDACMDNARRFVAMVIEKATKEAAEKAAGGESDEI